MDFTKVDGTQHWYLFLAVSKDKEVEPKRATSIVFIFGITPKGAQRGQCRVIT